MKYKYWVFGIVFLLITGILASARNVSAADDEPFTITVIGGHAEDMAGNVITEAKTNQEVVIVWDKKDGEYLLYWSSDGSIIHSTSENFSIFFVSPDSLTLSAVTTSERIQFTVDLTEEQFIVPQEMNYGIREFLRYMWADSEKTLFDLDGDGNSDILFYDSEKAINDSDFIIDKLTFVRLDGYSLGTDYTVTSEKGVIESVTFVVNNTNAEEPVCDVTPAPTLTEVPQPTVPAEMLTPTPVPTEMQEPTAVFTPTPVPTEMQEPTAVFTPTPVPMETQEPVAVFTPTPVPDVTENADKTGFDLLYKLIPVVVLIAGGALLALVFYRKNNRD